MWLIACNFPIDGVTVTHCDALQKYYTPYFQIPTNSTQTYISKNKASKYIFILLPFLKVIFMLAFLHILFYVHQRKHLTKLPKRVRKIQ